MATTSAPTLESVMKLASQLSLSERAMLSSQMQVSTEELKRAKVCRCPDNQPIYDMLVKLLSDSTTNIAPHLLRRAINGLQDLEECIMYDDEAVYDGFIFEEIGSDEVAAIISEFVAESIKNARKKNARK